MTNYPFKKIVYFSTCILAASLCLILASYYVYQQEIKRSYLELSLIAGEKARGLENDLELIAHQTRFLSTLPAVKHIANLSLYENTHVPKTTALSLYEENLTTLFKIYLDSLPDLIQARYIGVHNDGKELVRVNKENGQSIKVPKNQLQQKGTRDYFKIISQLPDQEIYISDITLNQENGVYSVPYLPVIRIGIPIYIQKAQHPTLFGAIVINANAEDIFKKIKSSYSGRQSKMKIYVMNSQGDFLAHPDKNKTFGFQLGSQYRWFDEFTQIDKQTITSNDAHLLQVFNTNIMAQETVYLDSNDLSRTITIAVTVPARQAIEKALWFALFSTLILCAALFIYLYRHNKASLKSKQLQLESSLHMEKEIHDIINNDPHGKIIVNRQGKITMINAHIEQVFGYQKKELLNQPLRMLLPERYRDQHNHFMQGYFATPEVKSMGKGRDLFGLHKQGFEVPLEIGLSPILYKGESQTLCGIIDISLRKKLEKQFELLIEAAPTAIMLINQSGEIELVNKEAESMFEYSRTDLLAHPLEKLIPLHYQPMIQEWIHLLFDNTASAEKNINKDIFGLRSTHVEFPISINLRTIETPQGIKLLSSITDLTERFKKDLALRHLSGTLDRTNKMAGVGGWDIDLITKEIFFTEETYRIYGLPLNSEVTMEQLLDSYTPESQLKLKSAIEQATNLRKSWDLELPFTTKKGKSIWVRTIGTLECEEDKASRIVATLQDISERKFYVDELSRSNIELHNFAYVASHDLKSPLRGIDQLATWLEEDLEGILQDEDAEHLRLMRVRISRMEQLLDDLLTYSRAGKKGSLKNEVNINTVIPKVFDLCNVKQAFTLHIDGTLPTFTTESIPLEQVFRNLINNAIKHSDKQNGEIRISATRKNNFYVFRVKDDGPGIPPEHEERVFTMFQTLRPRDEVEGSGMGLAIVRKIVTTFGGEITLERSAGRGASFVFTWPIE